MASLNDRKMAITYKKQSAYGTRSALTTSPLSHLQLLAKRDTKLDYKINLTDNADELTGSADPTEEAVGKHETDVNLNIGLDAKTAPILIHSHFGNMTATPIAESGTGVGDNLTVYAFGKQDLSASQQLPAREIVDYRPGSENSVVMPSMISRALNFSITNDPQGVGNAIGVSQQFVGSGVRIPNDVIFSGGGAHVDPATNRSKFTNIMAYLLEGFTNNAGSYVSGSNRLLTDCTLQSLTINCTNEQDPKQICIGNTQTYFYDQAGTYVDWSASLAVTTDKPIKVGRKLYFVRTAGTLASTALTDVTGNPFTSGTAVIYYAGVVESFGFVSGRDLTTKQVIELQFVAQPATKSRFVAMMQGREPLFIRTGVRGSLIQTGHYEELLFDFQLAKYNAVESGYDNDNEQLTISAKIYLNQVSQNSFTGSLKNRFASTLYL